LDSSKVSLQQPATPLQPLGVVRNTTVRSVSPPPQRAQSYAPLDSPPATSHAGADSAPPTRAEAEDDSLYGVAVSPPLSSASRRRNRDGDTTVLAAQPQLPEAEGFAGWNPAAAAATSPPFNRTFRTEAAPGNIDRDRSVASSVRSYNGMAATAASAAAAGGGVSPLVQMRDALASMPSSAARAPAAPAECDGPLWIDLDAVRELTARARAEALLSVTADLVPDAPPAIDIDALFPPSFDLPTYLP
jgi:hypothetical protein